MRKNYSQSIYCLITVSLILITRNYSSIFYPILHCEDGRDLLAHHYNNDNLSSIIQYYMGYFSLYPNLISKLLILTFPIETYPYLSVFFAILPAIAAYTIFSLPIYRALLNSDIKRSVICVFLALFPLGTFAISTALMYTLWHLLIVYIFLLLLPPPKTFCGNFFYILISSICIFSHPLSLVFSPLLIIKIYTNKKSWKLYSALLLISSAYLILGRDSTVKLEAVNLVETYKLFLLRVIIEPIFGNFIRLKIYQHNLPIIPIGTTIFLAIAAWFFKASKGLNKDTILIAVFTIFSIFVAAALSRSGDILNQISSPYGERYFYIEQFFLLFLFIYFLLSREEYRKYTSTTTAIFFLIYIATLNFQNQPFFNTDKAESERLMFFLRAFHDGKGETTLDRDTWSIHLIP